MRDGRAGMRVQRAVDHLGDHVRGSVQHVLIVGAAFLFQWLHEEAGSFPK